MKQSEYLEYLHRRSRLGLAYRRMWLYPRICRQLRGRVLDVGCGIGDMLAFRPETVGADVDPSIVEFCNSRGMQVHLIKDGALPFDAGSFDGVNLDNVLEHIVEPKQLLAEAHRVLKPAGKFVVGVPGKKGYASDPDHKRFYSEEDLVRVVEGAGFRAHRVMHMPLHLPVLTSRLGIYALYGVFARD